MAERVPARSPKTARCAAVRESVAGTPSTEKSACGRFLDAAAKKQEIGVYDDAIHEQRGLLEQFAIADSHSQAAGGAAARPAFPDRPLGVDAPEHGRAAISAADMVAELPDSFTFRNGLIPAPCAFGRARFLVDRYFDDRIKFSIAGVFGVFQYLSRRSAAC